MFEDRAGVVAEGVVLLRFLPLCVYVLFDDSEDSFLHGFGGSDIDGAPQPVGQKDRFRGILAIEPIS